MHHPQPESTAWARSPCRPPAPVGVSSLEALRARLQAPAARAALSSGPRQLREEQVLLGMPPPALPLGKGPCAGPLVTQPSHTAAPAPADRILLCSHSDVKWRSGSKAFHWRGCSAGLSSPSAFPQGKNGSESLSCQPGASCPDQTHLQTLPLQPCALGLDHPSRAVELPVAFRRRLSLKLIPGSACSSGGKVPPKAFGGYK